jgi:hypothetical protein
MDFIYGRAQNVLVWLGNHKPPPWIEDGNISDMISDWSSGRYDTWVETMYWLHQLIHKEYWKRVWIIQEIGMAHALEIYFGSRSIKWMEFYELVDKYNKACASYPTVDPNIGIIDKLHALRQAKYRGGESYSLSHLLKSFQDSFASVMHDKIYGFVGMSNDHFDNRIPVDYTKSPFELYRDVIVFQNISKVDKERNKMEMVYFSALVRNLLSRTSELTNRVGRERVVRLPGFTSPVDYPIKQKDLWWFRRNVRIWQPSQAETPEMWFVTTLYEGIEVLGFPVGTIQRIGPSYADFISSSDAAKKWDAQILEHFSKDSSDLKTARGKNERLKRLLNAPDTELRLLNLTSIEEIFTEDPQQHQPRFFIGSGIVLGMVPEGSNSGDIICQFLNVKAAAVLRSNEHGSYRYIGRAFIIGNANEWDNPTDMNRFTSARALDLTMSLNELTHLSFDTVHLELPPSTSSSFDHASSGWLSEIVEEMKNWIWAVLCLDLLLFLVNGRVKGMKFWEWVVFILLVVWNMLLIMYFFHESLARIVALGIPFLRKRTGNWEATIFIVLAMVYIGLPQDPWEGILPYFQQAFSLCYFLPIFIPTSAYWFCNLLGLDDSSCQSLIIPLDKFLVIVQKSYCKDVTNT